MKFNLKLITNNFTLLAIIEFSGILSGFLSLVILTRILDPNVYGAYAYYLVLFAISGNIFNFSTYQALVKEVNKQEKKSKNLIISNIILELLCGLLAFVFIGSYLFFSEFIFSSSTSFILIFSIFFLGVILEFLKRGLSSAFLALNKIKSFGFSNNLSVIIFFLVLAIFSIFQLNIDTIVLILLIKVLSNLLSCLIMFLNLSSLINFEYVNNKITPNIKKLLKLSFYPLISSFLSIMFYNTDIVMIKWLRESEIEIGILYNALKLALLITFFIGVIGKVIYPIIAKNFNNKDFNSFEIIDRFNNYYFKLFLPFALILHFSAHWINSSVFPPEYYESGYIFSIWVIFVAISISYAPGLQILFLKNKEKLVSIGLFICVFINVTLNYFFIPTYGPIGAVFASGISIIINTIYTHYCILKNIKDYSSKFTSINLISLAIFIIIIILSYFSFSIIILYAVSMIYIMSYLCLFIVNKEIRLI